MKSTTIKMASGDLVAFHLRIDQSIKEIMKDGKIDEYDIPEIMLLLAELTMTPTSKKMSAEDLTEQLNQLYEYIMTHYKLFPEDERQKQNFKRLFDMSLRLVLIQPTIKAACKSCLF
jgi:hypothetical protein